MRAITIRQPYAGAIFADEQPKEIENRASGTEYRGPLLIHAGQHLADGDAFADVERITGAPVPVLGAPLSPSQWAVGAVIGVVDLVAVHTSAECECRCSPWALQYRKHLKLARPRRLARPIPANGKLGIWTPDEELAAAVRKQVTL